MTIARPAQARVPVLLKALCQIFRADWQAADALSGCGEDRVAKRGDHGRHGKLACSSWLFFARNDIYFDGGHCVEAQDRIVIEISLRDAAARDCDLSVERRRKSIRDRAFTLHDDV